MFNEEEPKMAIEITSSIQHDHTRMVFEYIG